MNKRYELPIFDRLFCEERTIIGEDVTEFKRFCCFARGNDCLERGACSKDYKKCGFIHAFALFMRAVFSERVIGERDVSARGCAGRKMINLPE